MCSDSRKFMPIRPILESEKDLRDVASGRVTGTLRLRYFFHISGDGKTFEDDTGAILPDAETARLHASVIAAELAQGGDEYYGFDVCAVDEDGNEIARMPVVVPS
jgi:hypothetical protein